MPALPYRELAERHPGISPGISLSLEEAARVCLERLQESPASFHITHNQIETEAEASWDVPEDGLWRAWNNETDAIEAAACALGLASIELCRGYVAIRRAETKTGADYYLDKAGSDPNDLETALRLEISGTASPDEGVLTARLKAKLKQAANDRSSLPAVAVVVGLAQARILAADVA